MMSAKSLVLRFSTENHQPHMLQLLISVQSSVVGGQLDLPGVLEGLSMIRTGLDILLAERLSLVRGRRSGLVTHPAAVLADLTHALAALCGVGAQPAALFGPEHGIDGAAAEGAAVAHGSAHRADIPVYSLYGETMEPAPAMLAELDMLIFDMQDVGARYYTYLSTLFYVMRAAGRAGLPVIVLDRPNPLGGVAVEGPLLKSGFESFVGIGPLPVRHGLTIGELAGWLNVVFQLGVDLTVVPMRGWRRELWFDDTGRHWVPTSPAMAHLAAVALYPGTCLIEGINLSIGRGTALPFEICGAPWLDGQVLAAMLNARDLPGVRFRPLRFTPAGNQYAGQECGGVQVHVTDRSALRPVALGLELAAAIRAQYHGAFVWNAAHFDRLIGTDQVRLALEAGSPVEEIGAGWREDVEHFLAERSNYLFYS
jgi:uncharacterized protein YbbC (DUF1343 family)